MRAQSLLIALISMSGAAWAEAPSPPPIPRTPEEAAAQKARALEMRREADRRLSADEEICHTKLLVADCLSAARKRHTALVVEARKLEQPARDAEREARRQDLAAKEAQRKAEQNARAVEDKERTERYRAEEAAKASEREQKLADKARKAEEGRRKTAEEQARRQAKQERRARKDAERQAKKAAHEANKPAAGTPG